MKPTMLRTHRLPEPTPEQKFATLGPFAIRHGRFEKGTVLRDTQVEACPRVKVADFPPGFIPRKFFEKNLEQNQLIASCCRHPENHDIAAFKSHPEEKAPDIYIMYCQCGRRHIRFICARTDDVKRPIWSAA
jgi:hypothetical protein